VGKAAQRMRDHLTQLESQLRFISSTNAPEDFTTLFGAPSMSPKASNVPRCPTSGMMQG